MSFLPTHSWFDVVIAALGIVGLSGLAGAAVYSRWLSLFLAVLLSCLLLDNSASSDIVHWFCQGEIFASLPAITVILLYSLAHRGSTKPRQSRHGSKGLVRTGSAFRRQADIIDLYRRRNPVFYYSIIALALTTLFLFGSWRAWWQSVNQANSFDPTAFEWIYIFLMVLQVVGVVITILLFREVRGDRIEVPEDLFRVFRTSLLEAAVDKEGDPVVLHHLAPFPGLYQMLSSAFEVVPRASSSDGELEIVPLGQWAGFLRDFDRAVENAGANRPRIVLSMLQYWKVVDGKRQYKDSALYKFLVGVCQSEPIDPDLSRRFWGSPVGVGQGITLSGFVRHLYHIVALQLLERIDNAAREGKIELFVRDIDLPHTLAQWNRPDLGFTFIATHSEAYLGLPEVRGDRIKFASLRVDFQRDAVRALEELVRNDPTWGYQLVLPATVTSEFVTDGINPQAESV